MQSSMDYPYETFISIGVKTNLEDIHLYIAQFIVGK